jgi:heme-degrading monooxygenase HmoA
MLSIPRTNGRRAPVDWHVAQINIAKFRLPRADPANADFEAALDRVNATAETAPGFVWRMMGEGENADGAIFDDPDITINLTVWQSLDHLAAFAYRNPVHRTVMRRRGEWFVELPAYLAIWWISAGRLPTLEDAKTRLDLIARLGPTCDAFDFRTPFPPPA